MSNNKNVLICGDSFAADYSPKYPDKLGWPNLLAALTKPINGTKTLSGNECSECNPPIIITLLNTSSNNTINNPESIII